MRMVDIIQKKKSGAELSEHEIRFFIDGAVSKSIPEYQISAFLMAVCFQGMTERETLYLTLAMADSGDKIDLSPIAGVKTDKHSTGGVGDKTTLIAAPLAASCGAKVAKMSGRALGHTGGTIDKLESIPGFKTTLSSEEFIRIANQTGICIISQTGNLAPADKILYALRDVTATVDSIPLIASSIMSKKIAAGADAIVLDVKYGSGAFMKTPGAAELLAHEMIQIGNNAKRKTIALVTNMDIPLGTSVGNNLEVIEAVKALRCPSDFSAPLIQLCLELASQMVSLSLKMNIDCARQKTKEAFCSGAGFDKLCEMVRAQGGEDAFLRDTSLFPTARYVVPFQSADTGFISAIDTEAVGRASNILGAGRMVKTDSVDSSAGIVFMKSYGDYVREGDIIAQIHTGQQERILEARQILNQAVTLKKSPPPPEKIIFSVLS